MPSDALTTATSPGGRWQRELRVNLAYFTRGSRWRTRLPNILEWAPETSPGACAAIGRGCGVIVARRATSPVAQHVRMHWERHRNGISLCAT